MQYVNMRGNLRKNRKAWGEGCCSVCNSHGLTHSSLGCKVSWGSLMTFVFTLAKCCCLGVMVFYKHRKLHWTIAMPWSLSVGLTASPTSLSTYVWGPSIASQWSCTTVFSGNLVYIIILNIQSVESAIVCSGSDDLEWTVKSKIIVKKFKK